MLHVSLLNSWTNLQNLKKIITKCFGIYCALPVLNLNVVQFDDLR